MGVSATIMTAGSVYSAHKQSKSARENRKAGERAANDELSMRKEELAYAKEKDAADRALATEQDQRNYDFGQEQFNYAKDLDSRNLARADEQDAYRKSLVNDMLGDAEVSDGELRNRVGDASSDVTRAFTKSDGITRRNLASYGINPASGRYAGMMKDKGNAMVAADVAARNGVRTGVRNEEKAARINARKAGLGLNDTSLNLNNNQLQQDMPGVHSTELSLNPGTATAMRGLSRGYGNIANRYFSLANQDSANAASTLSSGLSSGAMIYRLGK